MKNQLKIQIFALLIVLSISGFADNVSKNYNSPLNTYARILQDKKEYVDQYRREDLYLYNEGVTALAYDDFLHTKFIPNIEYLGSGYNIAYGNPLSTQGVDPGYTTYNAFKFQYAENKNEALSKDRDFFIPNGVNLQTKSSCDISYSSQVSKSQSEYQSNLSVNAKAEGGFMGFSFAASSDFNKRSKQFRNEENSFIESTAKCSVYKASVDAYQMPALSDSFISALKKLANNLNNRNAYYEFFKRFGTHMTKGIELGSLYGYSFQMKKTELSEMQSQDLSISLAVKTWGGGVNASTDLETQSKQAFENAMQDWSVYTIGHPPNAENDPIEWAKQSSEKPMPIQGEFVQWSDFINDYIVDNEVEIEGLGKIEIGEVIYQLENNLQTYCSQFLLPQKQLQSCFPAKTGNNQSYGKLNDDWLALNKEQKQYDTAYIKYFSTNDYPHIEVHYCFEGNKCTGVATQYLANEQYSYSSSSSSVTAITTSQSYFGLPWSYTHDPLYIRSPDRVLMHKDSGLYHPIYRKVQTFDANHYDKYVYTIQYSETTIKRYVVLQVLPIKGDNYDYIGYLFKGQEGQEYQHLSVSLDKMIISQDNRIYRIINKKIKQSVVSTNQNGDPSSILSMCITTRGWGYYINEDHELYYVDYFDENGNSIVQRKKYYNESGQILFDNQINSVDCEQIGTFGGTIAIAGPTKLYAIY